MDRAPGTRQEGGPPRGGRAGRGAPFGTCTCRCDDVTTRLQKINEANSRGRAERRALLRTGNGSIILISTLCM
jgi:hypothetical protein